VILTDTSTADEVQQWLYENHFTSEMMERLAGVDGARIRQMSLNDVGPEIHAFIHGGMIVASLVILPHRYILSPQNIITL